MMENDRSIRNLSANLRGNLLQSGERGYDDVRKVWNAMIDRRPALIVQALDIADVRTAVNFARDHEHAVAVRAGGHNVAGSGVSEGGVVVDLGMMRDVDVDPDLGIAWVQGGALLADLDRATAAHGLATPGGVVSSTGVGGLALGGGFGWLARKHGLAADHLLSLELITGDGERMHASADENADLFWALRGGGGNFGIVTRFAFKLHPLRHEVLFGPTVYRLEDAPEVLRRYREFCAGAPRECCVWAALLNAPPLPFLPERFHGRPVLSLMQCYSGSDWTEGKRILAGLHTAADPIGDGVAPRPYVEAQQFLDQAYEHGARNYWSTQSYVELPDAAIDTLTGLAATLPAAESDILISQLGGAIDDVAPEATAYPHRGIRFAVTVGARWRDPADDTRCVTWARDGGSKLAPGASGGQYVNFVAEASGSERDAYGVNFQRLQNVKRRIDPSNLFRVNQNVVP